MKRTKLKTFAALSIAVMCGTAMFTGCFVKPERPKATAENVIIQYWHSSGSVDYVKLAADNFNASQSDYVVYPIPNASAGAMVETFGHADIDETTLYMATLNGIGEDRLNKYAEPLNEVFEADVDGKGVKIKEKINPYFLDSLYDSTGTNVLRSTYGGFLFLGFFLGFVFLFATVLIIYYKQVSEGYDDRGRFRIMQQVGMTPREVKATIRTQVLLMFFLPLVTAAIHIAFAFPLIKQIVFAFGLQNVHLFLLCTLGTFGVFALLYTFVYLLTARSYYRIVRMTD